MSSAEATQDLQAAVDAAVGEYALPDNSDTRLLMFVIFGSMVLIMILTCFISCMLGMCGKCQGKQDKSAIYNSTEANKVGAK